MLARMRRLFWNAYGTFYTVTRDLYNTHKPIIEARREGPVMVLGSPRSGTTWVGSVISKMLRARQVFEPFLLDKSGHFYFTSSSKLDEAKCNRNYLLYIRANSSNSKYARQLDDILLDRRRDSWRDKDCSPGFYGRRLIKDVRANLFMAYIAHNRPHIKLIWIVRNPVSVIESQVAMKEAQWDFNLDPGSIKAQPDLLDDFLSPFLHDIEAARGHLERLSHRWCIETFVPTRQGVADYPNVLLVRYEDLIKGPEEWTGIRDFLECRAWNTALLSQLLVRPSLTSRKLVLMAKRREPASRLSGSDVAQIIKTVAAYGLEGFLQPKLAG